MADKPPLLNNTNNIMLNDFDNMAILGSGSFGDVYLVKHKQTNCIYAMKSLKKYKLEKKIERVITECTILMNLNHPFIAKLQFCFQTQERIYFVMRYCPGGDFYNVIKRQPNGCLTETQTKFYSSCILLALEYLHFNGIIYRDLKPENILMDRSGHIILTDFDLSVCSCDKIAPRLVERPYSHINGACTEPIIKSDKCYGTPYYMAPEIITCKFYGSTVDWWSFGILIFEMLCGVPPFQGNNNKEIFNSICKCHLEFPNQTPCKCKLSTHAKNLIKKLLDNIPEKRLGFKGGATEIKDHPYFNGVDFQLLKNQTPPIVPQLIDELDHHYFNNKYSISPLEDDSKMIDPNMLDDGNIWKTFGKIFNNK